jgi:dTMP kinase
MPRSADAARVRGRLVTFEGIDGSGKSTACRALVDALVKRGGTRPVRAHVEPTRSWLGEAVRRGFKEEIAPWSEALLFMADHASHVAQVKRELAEGALVISDRWSDSTFAYQGAALDAFELLQQMEKPFDLKPDLTILFDLEPKLAMQRVGARAEPREKFEREEFLAKVRANYLRLAKAEPKRFVVLDAARPAEAVMRDAEKAILVVMASEQS